MISDTQMKVVFIFFPSNMEVKGQGSELMED